MNNDRMNIVDGRIQNLEARNSQMEQNLTNDYTRDMNSMSRDLSSSIHNNSSSIENLSSNIQNIRKTNNNLMDRIENNARKTTESLTSHKREISGSINRIKEDHRRFKSETKNSIEALSSRSDEHGKAISSIQDNITRTQNANERRFGDLSDRITKNSEHMDNLHRDLIQTKQQITSTKRELDSKIINLRDETFELMGGIDNKIDRVDSELRTDMNQLNKNHQYYVKHFEQVNSEIYNELENQREYVQSGFQEMANQFNIQREEYHSLFSDVDDKIDRTADVFREALLQTDARIDSVCEEFSQGLSGVNQRVTYLAESVDESFNIVNQNMEYMRNEYSDEINKLGNEFDKKVDYIQEDIVRIANSLDNKIDITKDQLNDRMEKRAKVVNKQFKVERRERTAQYEELKSEINDIKVKENERRKRAFEFAESTINVINNANKEVFDRFAPGELDNINGLLDMVQENINNDDFNPAYSTAQTAYSNFLNVRETVLKRQLEYKNQYTVALAMGQKLIKDIDANKEFRGFTEDDTIVLDIIYWSEGRLEKTAQAADELLKKLIEDESELTTDIIKNIIEKIQSVREEMVSVTEEAINRVWASQFRYSIARHIADALEEEGFSAINTGYLEDIELNPFYVKLENVKHSEIICVVYPDKNVRENCTVHIEIEYNDKEIIREETLIERTKNIENRLSEFGIHVSGFTAIETESINTASLPYERSEKAMQLLSGM
ncbi:hypothetical protein ACFL6P_00115 [Candidatus Latescibacterota bacterium]